VRFAADRCGQTPTHSILSSPVRASDRTESYLTVQRCPNRLTIRAANTTGNARLRA